MVEQSAVNRSVVGSSPTRGANFIWPVGQAVKTPPFHGGIPGSIPGRVTTWTISSAGRAPALQAGCRQFDPVIVHQRKRLSSDDRFFVIEIKSKSTTVVVVLFALYVLYVLYIVVVVLYVAVGFLVFNAART